MKIAFVTTQSLAGSTVIGRVLPLAQELTKNHEVHVLVHGKPNSEQAQYTIHSVGQDPFFRTSTGKKRLKGIPLIIRLKWNAIFSALKLIALKPDVIIIVKSLPENVLATWLATRIVHPKKIILDVDDFELTANVTSSLIQRAAIHSAERTGAKLADHIITVTPFLSDHFEQLVQNNKQVTMIPTGLSPLYTPDVYKDVHIGSESPVLVYAGSLTLSSGHRIDLLPDILSEVRKQKPEIKLHIFGDGDDVEKLKAMFIEKNLENAVVWHGRFSPAELPNQLPENCFLLDTIDNHIVNRAKSSFRVALAGILGLPVVSSDIGIRPYLIPDELHARFFATPGDATDYAAKVVALIKQPLTQAESDLLQRHAAQFSWQTLSRKYEKIISE